MLTKRVKIGAELDKEEIRRGSDHYIHQVDTPDGLRLRATNTREAFRQNSQNRFTKEPDLYEKEFHSYLADVHRLSWTEAADCEGEITEGEVHLALKKVDIEKGWQGQISGT